jgi:hypothetical protein
MPNAAGGHRRIKAFFFIVSAVVVGWSADFNRNAMASIAHPDNIKRLRNYALELTDNRSRPKDNVPSIAIVLAGIDRQCAADLT